MLIIRQRAVILLAGIALVGLAHAGAGQAQEPTSGIRRARQPLPGRYIVVLQDNQDLDAISWETAVQHQVRTSRLFRRTLNGFAARMTPAAAEALANDPRVKYVEEDGVVRLEQVQSSPPWGLDRIDQRALPLDGLYSYPSSGAGVRVHVIDTGIRTTHVDFGGRAFIHADYVDDDGDGDPLDVGNDDADMSAPDGADCHGHGTHVAGTIGGATYGVAKNVTLYAHRVLDCAGHGWTSGVIAAVEAVTADPVRPAVANMSLGGDPSDALDDAIRESIAAGVTYSLAAGNQNANAANFSPARTSEAITVGSTTSNDSRSSFSNFGPVLDLFAPGSAVVSAWHISDTATRSLSGTSMAAPHVAGAIAVYLETHPDATPGEVREALVGQATPDVVANAGAGSPNRLLSVEAALDPSRVTLVRPTGGERLFTGTPFTIAWDTPDDSAFATFDVLLSTNRGASYQPIPDCTGIARTERSCTWLAPGPLTTEARIRIEARNGAALLAFDQSTANVSIVAGAATLTISQPGAPTAWAVGSTQRIKWSHNLGNNSHVRIDLSRDGGVTFTETLVDALKNSAGSSGTFLWEVAGPHAAAVVVRVSWLGGAVSDVSDAPVAVAPATLTVTAPNGGEMWAVGTTKTIRWTSNIGTLESVRIDMSIDGGMTFPIVVIDSTPSDGKQAVTVSPAWISPTALIRITWLDDSSVHDASNATFRVQ
jgi:aqualysin 1